MVLLSVFMASWLRREVAGSSVSLSWHPLQNNWMAYQVTPPWSLIALFRSWQAKIRTPLHHWKKALYCLGIINSLQHVYRGSLVLTVQQSALSKCNIVILHYLSLEHFSLQVEMIFATFSHLFSSVIDLTDWLIHVWRLQYLLIERWAVVQELSDSIMVFNNDNHQTELRSTFTNKDKSWSCFCTASPQAALFSNAETYEGHY